MKKILLFLTLITLPFLSFAQAHEQCATMHALSERMQNDAAYAAFRQSAIAMNKQSSSALPCDGSNSVTIPLAFHFDASFTCADPSCLLTKVQEQIDAINIAFADNSTIQQNIDLEAACPTGYPLSAVSTGTCVEFKLGVPPAGQGLDPVCDPAITIGQFSGGTQTDFNGAGAAWAGYLNVFVVEQVPITIFGIPIPGIIGVADGIPGLANGDGITILADAFGGVGTGCNSGNDLDIGATDGASFFFTEGGTTAHEIGHYLGLYHIWGDDEPLFGGTPPYCTDDDSTMPTVGPFTVNDTPLQSAATPTNAPCPTAAGATCASLPATCDGTNDYFHNYMDYSNDICLSMFTADQSVVINYWANELFGGSTIGTFDAVPASLPTACDGVPCGLPVVCPVATSIDTPADACTLDGTQTVCVTFDIDPTGLVNLDINGTAGTINGNQICVDVPLPANQTCTPTPLDFILTATCTEDNTNILDDAGAEINGSIGTANIYPEPLTVITTGNGECTTLGAQLIAANADVCQTITEPCVDDMTSLSYDFSVMNEPVGCVSTDLAGTLTCGGCVVPCTAVAGTISTSDNTTVCALDGNDDIINATVSGQTGENFGWLITDGATGDILSMGVMAAGSTTFSPNLEGAPAGTCQIWSISWDGNLSNANQGDNAADITSDVCFELSNPIDVVRETCICEEAVSYNVYIAGCDMTGATIELLDASNNSVATAALGSNGGSGTLGVQACGDYSIVINSAPACYTDAGGDVGPRLFNIDGEGSTNQSFVVVGEEVPTVGEWGLMILALLMLITAIVGIRQRSAVQDLA